MIGSPKYNRRQNLKTDYENRLALWKILEPPKWRFIAHKKWKNEKPKRTW